MKTYNFSITLKQNSENIKWVEDVLHSGLNPGESITLHKEDTSVMLLDTNQLLRHIRNNPNRYYQTALSEKLSEVNGNYTKLTDVLDNFNLSLDPVHLYDELENLLDLVNELKQDINTLNDLLAK